MPPPVTAAEVERLYREYGAMVYRRAVRLLGNRSDAEEATQEVFIRVLRTEAAYEGKGALIGWLYRITTHYCLNRIRDQRRRRDLFTEHVAPAVPTASVSAPTDLMMLRQLLADADERQAQAAIYVYLDGMSYEEAAPLLGVSKRTVGNLLERFAAWCQQLAAQSASGKLPALPRTTETP
jgi:RNA polymerase sigma-70 factor (ECF subfamily)